MIKAITSALLKPGPSRILGITAIVFLAATTLAYIPAQIFISNRDVITAGALPLFTISLAAIGGAGIIAWTILAAIPERIARFIAAFMATLAVSAFFIGSILTPITVDAGLVDGGSTAFHISPFLKAADLVLMTALYAFIIMKFDRVQSFFVNIFIAGTALSLFYSAYAGLSQPTNGQMTADGASELLPFNANDFYALSSQENVFVILLDSFDSHFFSALLQEDPSLKEEFEGFTFFRDTAAVSPTTTGAMPTIHSGRMIPTDSTLGASFEDMIKRDSFLTKTAVDADVFLLNPQRNLCPNLVKCGNNEDLLMGGTNSVISQWKVLSAIAEFRIAPHILKPMLYDAEQWFTSLSPQTTDSNVLPAFVDNMTISATRPQVRFLHLMHTHTPYNRDKACNEIQPNNSSQRIAMNNMRCAMRGITFFLSELRSKSVYDHSLILIVADHGAVSLDASKISMSGARDIRITNTGRFFIRRSVPHPKNRFGDKLPQSSNPLFLIKPPNAHGALNIDIDRAVSLVDIPATICAYTVLCEVNTGFNAFSAPKAIERNRILYNYKMRPFQETFRSGKQIAEVIDPIGFNFSLMADPAADNYEISESLKFNSAGAFEGFGFSERWGRWSASDKARFTLCFDQMPKNEKILQMTARAYLPGPGAKQRVSIYVNDRLALQETYRYGDTKLDDILHWQIDIAPNELDAQNCSTIQFSLPDAIPAPATWREAGSRRIAIGLIEMRIEVIDR